MVSVPAWPPLAAAGFWPIAAPRAVSGCPPDPAVTSTVSRLKRRPEFLRVARTRRKWAATGLVLQARRQTPEEQCPGDEPSIRVGFTVTKKVGNAVIRNRIRRRLRVVVEQIMPEHARPAHDFVVIGRAATINRPFAALKMDLRKALRKLDAYLETECAADGGEEQG
jgi:ribonuclease P protein component